MDLNFGAVIGALKEVSAERGEKAYLVGGYIRDVFAKKGAQKSPEMDFAIGGSARGFAKELARRLKGAFVPLDEKRDMARVVLKGEPKISPRTSGAIRLDFNGLKGAAIEADLKSRDFTINAMACDTAALEKTSDIKSRLLDPCGGIDDITDGIIRATNANAFLDDPLRILRAFTFAAAFGFAIEKDTLDLIKPSVSKLNGVAGERIRDELSGILETEDSVRYVRMMDDLNIFEEIIAGVKSMRGEGQGPYHHLDIWGHSIETLARLEALLREPAPEARLAAYLNERVSDVRKRVWIIKLGALLHDIGKPETKETSESGRISFHGHEEKGVELLEPVTQRLKLSAKERMLLEDVALYHLRPAQLANAKDATKRAVFRLLRDMGESAPSVCLVTIADKRATQGLLGKKIERDAIEALCRRLTKEYFAAKEQKAPPKKLLRGEEVMEALNIPPGRIVGAILKEIEESQAEGSVKTKAAAIKLAKKIYRESK